MSYALHLFDGMNEQLIKDLLILIILRDTHIRQLKIFGLQTDLLVMGDTPLENFKTI